MADTLRIMSKLPVALRISEPHPDASHPGNSPELKQAVLQPGMNEGVDAKMFRAWSDATGASFVASADDVKAGNTDGKLYELGEGEPEQEFGFEPALNRAIEAGMSDAEGGSTRTEPGPLKAEEMRTGSADAANVPVLTASEPLKTPLVTDASKAWDHPAPVIVPAPAPAIIPAV